MRLPGVLSVRLAVCRGETYALPPVGEDGRNYFSTIWLAPAT